MQNTKSLQRDMKISVKALTSGSPKNFPIGVISSVEVCGTNYFTNTMELFK
jgi:hypothetical protein